MDNFNISLFKWTIMMDSRSWNTYAFRGGLVLVTMLIIGQFLASGVSAPGLQFILFLSSINLTFISLLGIAIFSSAITEEKELNSLNLLMMTGVTPLTVLLSKGIGKFCNGTALLLSQLPFILLAVTLGGISLLQVFAISLLILAYLFLVCNLALLCSTLCRRSSQAALLTFLLNILILFPLGPHNPFAQAGEILRTGFQGSLINSSFFACIALGTVFFILSLMAFNRFSRQSAEGTPGRSFIFRTGEKFKFMRISRAWSKRPLRWKEFHFCSGSMIGIIIRFVLLALIAIGWILNDWRDFSFFKSEFRETLGGIMIFGGLLFFLIDISWQLSTSFQNEVKWKTFPVLATLPLSPRQIYYEKVYGILPCALPGPLFSLAGCLLASSASLKALLPIGIYSIVILLLIYFHVPMTVYLSLKYQFFGGVLAFFVLMLCISFSCIGLLVILVAPFYLQRAIIRNIRLKSSSG